MGRKSNKKWVILCYVLIVMALIIQIVNALYLAQVQNLYGSDLAGTLPLIVIAYAANALALILAFVYLLRGYKKQDAKLYKAFMIVYGIALLLTSSTVLSGFDVLPVTIRILIPSFAVMVGILMVLTFAENLGEKKAMRFALSNLILVSVLLVGLLIMIPGSARGGEIYNNTLIINVGKYFVLAVILAITTKSKYVDKAERGTK